MADFDQIANLEEQLREDRRQEALVRRKRLLRRLWPVVLLALILIVLILLIVSRGGGETDPVPESTAEPADASVTLSFVGDIAMNREMVESFRSGSDFDFSPCFRRVTSQLTSSDLTIGNLEGTITDPENVADHAYPPSFLNALYDCGFDILQTANSYSIQNGITGLARTKAEIEQAGMSPVGTFADQDEFAQSGGFLLREVNGFRIAFIAFTKGVNNLRLPDGAEYCVNLLYRDYDTNYSEIARAEIRAIVTNARLSQPDVIIALVHWGSEYTQDIAESQKDIASILFSEGVSIIVGSHSHYVGPMELSDRKTLGSSNLIAYSLGDFLSCADTTSARNGCILNVRIERHGSEIALSEVSYTPTYCCEPSDSQDAAGRYEILDSLDAISFYDNGYYDRVSTALYDRLTSAVERMKEQTGAPQLLDNKKKQ